MEGGRGRYNLKEIGLLVVLARGEAGLYYLASGEWGRGSLGPGRHGGSEVE